MKKIESTSSTSRSLDFFSKICNTLRSGIYRIGCGSMSSKGKAYTGTHIADMSAAPKNHYDSEALHIAKNMAYAELAPLRAAFDRPNQLDAAYDSEALHIAKKMAFDELAPLRAALVRRLEIK